MNSRIPFLYTSCAPRNDKQLVSRPTTIPHPRDIDHPSWTQDAFTQKMCTFHACTVSVFPCPCQQQDGGNGACRATGGTEGARGGVAKDRKLHQVSIDNFNFRYAFSRVSGRRFRFCEIVVSLERSEFVAKSWMAPA